MVFPLVVKKAGLLAIGLSLLLPAVITQRAWGAEGESEADADRSPWSVFPILAYSPETNAMLGAGVVYTFDVDGRVEGGSTAGRRSALAFASAYTFKNQFFVSIAPSLYWDDEAWHAEGEINGKRFPNTFYPIGNDTAADRAEDYSDLGLDVAGALSRRLVGSFRTGGQAGAFFSKISKKEAGGDLDRDRVAGSDGGRLVGFGPVLSWDDRDNDFATRRGARYSLGAAYFAKVWGSQFNVSKYEFDARQFFPLGGEHVLGAQIYAVANLGTVPFQTMAALGGSNRMRGFFEGRYRDRHMLAAQVEYRFPVVWRFGAAVFSSVGDVAHDLDGFELGDFKAAGGAGIRFSLNQADRVNLRFDGAGTSTGDVNFYVALGEAF